MKFMLLTYNDGSLLDALPPAQADAMMRDCLAHADELRRDGCLIESRMLEGSETAKSLRIREADDMDEALRIAAEFPWARTRCVEVRPVRDIGAVRRRVGSVVA